MDESYKDCTEHCERMSECTVCHRTKKPIGRDPGVAASSGYCDIDCTGYFEEPTAGHLWPGELRSLREADDDGYPTPDPELDIEAIQLREDVGGLMENVELANMVIGELRGELAALLEAAEDMRGYCEEMWGHKYGPQWDAALKRARNVRGQESDGPGTREAYRPTPLVCPWCGPVTDCPEWQCAKCGNLVREER